MYLQKIIDYKKQELAAQKRKVSLKDVRHKAADAEPARDFLGGMKRGDFSIIAEIKKASPSAGVIRPDFDPLWIAQTYEENGAAALSILTDEHFFQGKLEHLEMIRQHVTRPLLRKDFTLDEYHIHEARGAGADAILLIAGVLEKNQLTDYQDLAQELGMVALVEVHDAPEMEKVASLKSRLPHLIGINNRDLKTFKVDLETSLHLAPLAPKESILVSESGMKSRDDLKKLKDHGIHVFLIGELFMRSPNPGVRLKELLVPLL